MKTTDHNSNNNKNRIKSGGINNTSSKKTKSPVMIPLKYPNKAFSKNEKGKPSKHISVPIFNMKGHNRSSSVTLSSPIMAISKFTSQLKSSINPSHRRSNSGNSLPIKTNDNNNSEVTSKKSKNSTPLSLPIVFRNNSTKTEEIHVSTPKINGISSIYTRSHGRCAASTPTLSYPNSINTTPKSLKSSITKNEPIYIPRIRRDSSLNSLSKTPKTTSSPLIYLESENESLNKNTRKNDHPSIKSLKNKSDKSDFPQEIIIKTNNKLNVKNDENHQNEIENSEISHLTINDKKIIQKNKKIIPNKIGSTDTVGSTNSNCTTYCTNTSCDNLFDPKEISLSQGFESNSSETINKESTYSMFMPKTVIGKDSLQHSMQKEINGIIERFDQTSLNDISGLDQESVRVHDNNNLLLTALNNDLKKSKNKNLLKNGILMTDNANQKVQPDESITELNNSTLEDQKIYISDIDIACLDLNRIKADLSENISEPVNFNSNNAITVAPVTITSFNNIPNVINNTITSNEKDMNLTKKTSKNKINIQSTEHNHMDDIETINAVTTNSNDAKNNNHTNINNKKDNNYNDSYLNEKINHQSLTKLLHGDVKTTIVEDTSKNILKNPSVQNNKNDKEQKPQLGKRTTSLSRSKNTELNDDDKKEVTNEINKRVISKTDGKSNNKLILLENNQNTKKDDEIMNIQKPMFNNLKHQSQPLQKPSSFLNQKNRHHYSEGYGDFLKDKTIQLHNENGELINNTENQMESLNSLKTALLFLPKNENKSIKSDNGKKNGSSSNKKYDSGSSIFSKRKSTNTVSTLNNQNNNNKKYLSLPSLFSSNTIMPLNADEDGMFDNCKVMYPVSRLDSGRKLRAYYGIDCPIFLGNGSKSKISNYYGANLYEEEDKNKEDKKKNQKFGIKRLTSFLHLSNNDLTVQESTKSKLKN